MVNVGCWMWAVLCVESEWSVEKQGKSTVMLEDERDEEDDDNT